MMSPAEALDLLAPISEWDNDWADVLRRADAEAELPASHRRVGRRRPVRRRVVLLVAVLAAIVVPLTALAAVNHWWFLRSGAGLPRPTQTPVVVTRGSWSGHPWSLVAYPGKSKLYGPSLCWGVTFSGHRQSVNSGQFSTSSGVAASRGAADGVGCGSIVGIRNTRPFAPNIPTVTYEWFQTSTHGYPSWLSGVVVGSATRVVVRWSALKARPPALLGSPHQIVRAATFPAPVAGYHVRVFAVPFPKALERRTRLGTAWHLPSSIIGTNQADHVVACYELSAVSNLGVTPLSICK